MSRTEAEHTLGKSENKQNTVLFNLKDLKLLFTNGCRVSKHKLQIISKFHLNCEFCPFSSLPPSTNGQAWSFSPKQPKYFLLPPHLTPFRSCMIAHEALHCVAPTILRSRISCHSPSLSNKPQPH